MGGRLAVDVSAAALAVLGLVARVPTPNPSYCIRLGSSLGMVVPAVSCRGRGAGDWLMEEGAHRGPATELQGTFPVLQPATVSEVLHQRAAAVVGQHKLRAVLTGVLW